MRQPRLSKPQPLDYAVMIGGPLLFLIIAYFGIRALVGPLQPENAVEKLKDGVVKVGMTEREVIEGVGPPRVIIEREDGGLIYRYQRGTWDSQRNTFVEEDADVSFNAQGSVSGVNFQTSQPPPPQ